MSNTSQSQSKTGAAIYARSSLAGGKTSIAAQLGECRARAIQDGVDAESILEFTDIASGSNSDRDGFERLQRAAEAGEFHVLYLTGLDRLHRDACLMTETCRKLTNLGVSIISLTDNEAGTYIGRSREDLQAYCFAGLSVR